MRRVFLFLILSFATHASAEESKMAPIKWSGAGAVEYRLEHRLHTVVGRSTEPEFVMVADENGLRVMARVRVNSFDSGNANRDAHTLEVVDAAHHPYVIVRGVAEGFRLPSEPKSVRVPFRGEIELKGVKVERPLEAVLEFHEDGAVSASFEFTQSLEAHEIERPSLFMIRVDDSLAVRGEARLEKVK